MGTAVGNKLYARGGWVASGSTSVAFIGVALLCCFARGPWEPGWLGWGGGWSIRRRDLGPRGKQELAVEQAMDELSAESGQDVFESDKVEEEKSGGITEAGSGRLAPDIQSR